MSASNMSGNHDRDISFDSSSRDALIGAEIIRVYQWVVCTVVGISLSLFGTATNIINIICFAKQGFTDSVNVNFLGKGFVSRCGFEAGFIFAELVCGLAISDLGSVTTIIVCYICYTPSFQDLDLPFEPSEFQYLVGGLPHVCFSRVTCWITALITLERCLCITMPLKVKSVISAKRTIIAIISLFVLSFISSSPVYHVSRFAWRFSSQRNRTLLRLVFTPDRTLIEGIAFIINNLIMPFIAFAIILICTATLVITLRRKQQWRREVSVSESVQSSTTRDTKVARMVVVISTLFIVCYIPICILFLAMSLLPDLSIEGKYTELILICGCVGLFLESTNSATNIIIYYRMSTKYKTVFARLFRHL